MKLVCSTHGCSLWKVFGQGGTVLPITYASRWGLEVGFAFGIIVGLGSSF